MAVDQNKSVHSTFTNFILPKFLGVFCSLSQRRKYPCIHTRVFSHTWILSSTLTTIIKVTHLMINRDRAKVYYFRYLLHCSVLKMSACLGYRYLRAYRSHVYKQKEETNYSARHKFLPCETIPKDDVRRLGTFRLY